MLKAILLILTLPFLKNSKTIPSTNIVANANIHFDFTPEIFLEIKDTIRVRVTIFNADKDTVYFLTTSCDGEQYSLQYDNTKFALIPRILCNVSKPLIAKIPPKKAYNFNTTFKKKINVLQMKLGFDFYEVDKFFIIKENASLNVHNRKESDQNILWSKTHNLQANFAL